jgi:signal transduction histidine kinase/ligand-binding sensor domain-containing protein
MAIPRVIPNSIVGHVGSCGAVATLLWLMSAASLATAAAAAAAAAAAGAAATLPSLAGEPSWSLRTWQIDDGSNNIVSGIAQTPDGYLWVSTSAGVNQFDGLRFTHYSLADRVGVPGSNVRLMLAGHDSGLWLVMDGSVVQLKMNSAPRVFRDGVPSQRPESVVEDDHGSLWIGYRGPGQVCRIKDAHVTVLGVESSIPAAKVDSLAVDTQGRLWLAADDRVGQIRAERFSEVFRTSTTAYPARASDGGLWICSGLTLYHYDEQDGLTTASHLPLNRAMTEPLTPYEDHYGTLWIGTATAGLFRYDGVGFQSIATPQARITCFKEDTEGNLWIGTDVGLDRISPRAIEVDGAERGLPFGSITSICQTPDGHIWASAIDGALMVRSADGRWGPAPFQIEGQAVCLASDSDGALWIGTMNRRLYRWRGEKLSSWDSNIGLLGRSVTALLPTRDGALWIGSIDADSVQCLRAGRLVNFKLPIGLGRIAAMAQDKSGNLWIGWLGKGKLMRMSGDQLIDETELIGDSPVNAFYVAPDDSLWIGFRHKGLGRLKDGQLRVITAKQGLYEDHVAQILADDRGWLWVASDHGIFKVRLSELNDCADGKIARVQSVHFGGDEALPRMQAKTGIFPSFMRGSDGRLWMIMANELAIVHPDRVREYLVPPPVQIERLVVDDQAEESRDYFGKEVTGFGETDNSPIKLQPDYHRLQFDFTALTFGSSENARFRYRLENFDEAWNETTEHRTAVYPRLPAGSYRFRVIAANADGIWNRDGAAVYLTVAPFIWQTWWFRVGASISVVAVLLLLVRYMAFRRLRLRLQLLEQRSALDAERARIARDIHDDLGHGLTQIALLSDMTQQDRLAPDELDEQLEQIASTARQGIKSLDETVWAINPRNDTLADLIDYIGHFVMQSLRSAQIKCELDLPEQTPELMLPSEVRHALFLVVKEAVNNILRHAHAEKVWLSITNSWDVISIRIADNGRGFCVAASGDACQDGLRNMRQRMLDIGGTFAVESSPGNGTRISLAYRWPRAGRRRPSAVAVGSRTE